MKPGLFVNWCPWWGTEGSPEPHSVSGKVIEDFYTVWPRLFLKLSCSSSTLCKWVTPQWAGDTWQDSATRHWQVPLLPWRSSATGRSCDGLKVYEALFNIIVKSLGANLSGSELHTPDYCTSIGLPEMGYVCGFWRINSFLYFGSITHHYTSEILENGPLKGQYMSLYCMYFE